MLLSNMLKPTDYYEIKREKRFDSLGILSSKPNLRLLTFLDDKQLILQLQQNDQITMVVTTPELSSFIPERCGYITCDNPRLFFFKLHNSMQSDYTRQNFDTEIGNDCSIHPLANIDKKNVRIGNHVVIEEFVSIKEGVVIGNNSIIRAGTVIGSSGFEFKRDDKEILSVTHHGGVKIGNHVEIKCNTSIDKAIYPWDDTEIGDYSKLDNLIHIGHACKIKKRVMIPAGSVIGGRVTIKDDAWIGIGCVIRNGITIGCGARCNMGAVVTKDVLDKQSVTGNFAIDHKDFIMKLKKG